MRILAALLMITALISTNARAQNDLSDAAKVKDYYGEWLSSLPGVNSVDVGMSSDGKPQIQIHTDATTPAPSQIPEQLNGIPVVVIADPPEGDDSSISPLAPSLVPPSER